MVSNRPKSALYGQCKGVRRSSLIKSGGRKLALELEKKGYAAFGQSDASVAA